MDITQLRKEELNLSNLILSHKKSIDKNFKVIEVDVKKINGNVNEKINQKFIQFTQTYKELNNELIKLAISLDKFEKEEIVYLNQTIADEFSQEDLKNLQVKLKSSVENILKSSLQCEKYIHATKIEVDEYNYQIKAYECEHKRALKKGLMKFGSEFISATKIESKYMEVVLNSMEELKEALIKLAKSVNMNKLISNTIKVYYNELEKEYTNFSKHRIDNPLEKFHRVKPRNKYKQLLRNLSEEIIREENLMNNINYLVISEIIIIMMDKMRGRFSSIYEKIKDKQDYENFAYQFNVSIREKKLASMFFQGKRGFYPSVKDAELKIIQIGNSTLMFEDFKDLYLQVFTIMIQYAEHYFEKKAFESDYQRGFINFYETSHQAIYLEGVLLEFTRAFVKKIHGQRNNFVNAINKLEEKLIEKNIMQTHKSAFNDFIDNVMHANVEISGLLSANKILLSKLPDKIERLSLMSKEDSPFKQRIPWYRKIFG